MAKVQSGMDYSQWLCLSCHDWACLCKAPCTVRRHSLGHGTAAAPPVVNPTVYERTYISPFPATWVNNKKTPDQILAESYVFTPPKPGTLRQRRGRSIESNALRKSTNGKYATAKVEQSEKKEEKGEKDEDIVVPYEYYFPSLTNSPITARKPFLVSSPHWASKTRSHTQQWPWKSGTQCRLWSATCHFDLAKTPKHRACWSPKCSKKL